MMLELYQNETELATVKEPVIERTPERVSFVALLDDGLARPIVYTGERARAFLAHHGPLFEGQTVEVVA